jgi:hypothetical protein
MPLGNEILARGDVWDISNISRTIIAGFAQIIGAVFIAERSFRCPGSSDGGAGIIHNGGLGIKSSHRKEKKRKKDFS